MKRDRRLVGGLALLAATAPWTLCARAQQPYPDKVIRIVVPFGPGGNTDKTGRLVADILGNAFKATVIVENRPGASGIVGTDRVAKSAPDGYTLLEASPQELTINPHLFSKIPYVAERDFIPVTLVASSPLVLVVNPSVTARSVSELVEAARARPGQLTFASSGNGSGGHLAGELLNISEKINIRHIPYSGAGAALTDVLGGQVNMTYLGLATVLPHIKAGKLRALAVSTAKRSPFAPDIPTMAESNITDYEVGNWWGLFAPAGVPDAIIQRLNATIVEGLRQPEVRARLAQDGSEPVGNSVAEFRRFVRAESDRYGRVIQQAGIKLD